MSYVINHQGAFTISEEDLLNSSSDVLLSSFGL